MNPSDNHNDFPSVPTSFLQQPHLPVFTFRPTYPLLATVGVEPESPPIESSLVLNPITPTAHTPLPWITSIVPHRSRMPYSSPTSIASSQPTNSAASSASKASEAPAAAQAGLGGLSKGTKAGIIAGIAVVVILVVLGCALGILDFNKRHKRRKERRNNRDAELTMFEAEMQQGRTGQKRDRRRGLWDNLKVDVREHNRNIDRPVHPEDMKSSRTGLWERVGETRYHEKEKMGWKGSPTSSERAESEVEWLPAYMPRERVSVVSSVGSLTHSLNGKPILPRSFVGEEGRR